MIRTDNKYEGTYIGAKTKSNTFVHMECTGKCTNYK